MGKYSKTYRKQVINKFHFSFCNFSQYLTKQFKTFTHYDTNCTV